MNQILTKAVTRWKRVPPSWSPIFLGLSILCLPTFFDLANGLWSTEGYVHAPIILCLSTWLIIRRWPKLVLHTISPLYQTSGWILTIVSLGIYIIGRSQEIVMLEIGSLVALLASILLIIGGLRAIKVQFAPLVLLCFIIPLPYIVLSSLTLPMKIAVSNVTEVILHFFGYPIARTGVILQIGKYQLMVADACSGLQSILTLEVLGIFYLNLVEKSSMIRNSVLSLLIIPISFASNVLRVIILTLITFYYGDAAGQGFLHGFAGMVLFITALTLIIAADVIIGRYSKSENPLNSQRIGE